MWLPAPVVATSAPALSEDSPLAVSPGKVVGGGEVRNRKQAFQLKKQHMKTHAGERAPGIWRPTGGLAWPRRGDAGRKADVAGACLPPRRLYMSFHCCTSNATILGLTLSGLEFLHVQFKRVGSDVS